jgi:hypothetical protein
MDTSTDEQAVISDALWRAWDRKREQAAARKMRAVVAIILGLAAIGGGFYVLAVR